jgi:hypothetical protein
METEKPKSPVNVSREDLYVQVWKTPLLRLAAQYGISGTGLSKICSRVDVPCPPAGYWAKLQAGKPVRQPPLPAAGKGIPSTVLISPTPERSPPPKLAADVQAKFDEALQKSAALEVPESLRRPHAVIAAWIADHARRVADSKRDKGSWAVRVEPLSDLDHRRHRILDTIFKAAEKMSFKVKSGQYQEVWLEVGRNRVDFSLQERIRQVRRPLRADEKNQWNSSQQWRQEKTPTGLLVFKIRTFLGPAIQVEWIDQPDMLLEQQVGKILAALTLAGPLLEEQRVKAEEAERRRREDEHRRQQEADRRKIERNRWRRFLEYADRWEEADRARRFIATIEASTSTDMVSRGGLSHEEWLTWAKKRLMAYDPLETGIESVWDNLASVTSWEYRD